MTLEHLYFIPFVLSLGLVLGSQLTRWRFARVATLPRRVTVRGVLVPLVAFAALFLLTHVFALHGGAKAVEDSLQGLPLFDQRASFAADEVYQRLELFGVNGRARYQHMTFTSDVVFPLALLAFLLQLARFINERSGCSINLQRVGLALPVLWFLCDLGENATVYHLIEVFPTRSDALAGSLGAITSLKFGLLVASVFYLGLLSVLSRTDDGTVRAS